MAAGAGGKGGAERTFAVDRDAAKAFIEAGVSNPSVTKASCYRPRQRVSVGLTMYLSVPSRLLHRQSTQPAIVVERCRLGIVIGCQRTSPLKLLQSQSGRGRAPRCMGEETRKGGRQQFSGHRPSPRHTHISTCKGQDSTGKDNFPRKRHSRGRSASCRSFTGARRYSWILRLAEWGYGHPLICRRRRCARLGWI